MNVLRAFVLRHTRLAMALVVAALCMKALVPAGYMLGGDTRTITIEICADALGHPIVKQMTVPLTGEKARADGPCHFTALGHAMLGGADPVQVALALVFILALGFASLLPVERAERVWLRPPSRGPPVAA